MLFSRSIVRRTIAAFVCCVFTAYGDFSVYGDDAKQTVTGVVYLDANENGALDEGERGLADIRVSNGAQIVATDENGRYELPINNDTIVFVIKPSGYRTKLNKDMLPRFHYVHKPDGSPKLKFEGVAPTGPLPESVDFPLYLQEEPDEFRVIYFGDPQPRNQTEIDYITHDVVEEVIGVDAAFGVTLGDVMFDDLSLFESLNKSIARIGLPWYNVVGNHDIDYQADDNKYARETFKRIYGPNYYSFDYGKVHFVIIDDIDWIVTPERRYYRTGLGEEQLEFLRNDFAATPEDMLVVVMMHIPLVDSTAWNQEDRDQLFRLMQSRKRCVSFSAHTHHHEHRFVDSSDGWPGDEPHHHIVHGTVCGSWWSGAPDETGIPHTIMSDGTPNGWGVMTFRGGEYAHEYYAARRPPDYHMQINAPESVAVGESVEFFANVFNAWPQADVQFRVDQGEWQSMEKTFIEDPTFLAAKEWEQGIENRPWRELPRPRKCPHLWKASLPTDLTPGTHTIQVRTQNPDGVKLAGKRIVRVVD